MNPRFPRPAAVIQVYAQWCGMSQTMVPVYKTLREKYDDENALLFCSIQAEKVEHTWEDPKGYEHLEAVYNRKGKSEPLFLIYRNGNLLEAVRVRWDRGLAPDRCACHVWTSPPCDSTAIRPIAGTEHASDRAHDRGELPRGS